MLKFSQKHKHPTNGCGFLWGISKGMLVKRTEIKRYSNREQNLLLGVDGLEKQKQNIEVAQMW